VFRSGFAGFVFDERVAFWFGNGQTGLKDGCEGLTLQ